MTALLGVAFLGACELIHIVRGLEFNFGNAAVTFDTAHLQFIFSQTLDVLPKVM